MIDNEIKAACKMINTSKDTLILTGAGISTESGIPDFRSPNTGLWEKIDPMEALSTSVLLNNPRKFYEEGFKLLTDMKDVKPNKGHIALAEMEEMGFIKGIITQNIDNLHQKAGSKIIYEVHGDTRSGRCTSCNNQVELNNLVEQVKREVIPPKCNRCGGILRPNVVMFGDQLPKDFNIAWDLVQNCELLIVVGSSLSVAPVSYLPQMASRLIIINLGSTPFDRQADIVIKERAGDALDKIVNELKKGT
ncbi:SIR2 family NAD-dependent protein deacylase [Sporosalibacterium faouarense]|uniref:SIR2 family NAD-dependent protein deacylase n=1 Tax=Sporosalibacterium faouarense TaxID=516123 RepID=UPI00192BADF5|nr:NAD-dependent deacylase [Sporosalibacterium faouarense]